MQIKQKKLAQKLRRQGLSLKEIVKKIGSSKSSVSLWVRNIELTPKQRLTLSEKGVSKDVIERRRKTRLDNENARRQKIIDAAKLQIKKLSLKELFLIGNVLYWAEGGKTIRGIVRLSNGDPLMIRLVMRFFREICKVPEKKFRGHIHIHPHLNVKRAENYWSEVSKIPLSQFYKTYNKMNKSSKNLRDTLPFGTFDIYVCNTELFLKIKGWIQKIQELYLGEKYNKI